MGSNVVDVLVKTDPEESDLIRIRHGTQQKPATELIAYPLGSKVLIDHLDFQVGGGGTNTAVCFSRLGFKTAYLGKIGRDQNGLNVFSQLKKERVDFLGTLGQQNGYSVILDSVGDDRTILTFKGCNNELSFSELDKKLLSAKAYYLCSMMGESLRALEHIAAHAKKSKALVAFNPSSYLIKQGIKSIANILKHTDVLILNDEEAALLNGSAASLRTMAKNLKKLGPSTIVITQGSKGACALYKRSFFEVSPKTDIVVHETTGAGDAFGSTLLAGMLMKKSFPQALRLAMINAESVIAHYGAKNILLSKEKALAALIYDKREVKKS